MDGPWLEVPKKLHVSRVARKHRRYFVWHRLRRIGTSGDDGKRSATGNRTKMARADIRLLISEKTARACMRESRRTVPATLIHQTRSARLRLVSTGIDQGSARRT